MPKKGVKVWQTEVQDNDSWKQELAKTGLLIVELFSEYFGYTEILTPMIDDIMKGMGDDAEKVRWRRVNVLKLEEELRSLEEEKKRSGRDAGTGGGDEAGGAEDADGGSPKKGPAAPSPGGIQGLTNFAGFHHPQPFFIFMRNGEILDILRSCDPPKLEKLTKLYSSDETARNADITFEIMLKTSAEIQAEKEIAAKKKAHLKKITSILERVDCEDPMSLVEAECTAMFGLFVVGEDYKGPAAEDTTWQEVAAGFVGKSIDNVCEHFSTVGEDVLEAVQAHLEASAAAGEEEAPAEQQEAAGEAAAEEKE